jgi:hypothetical protein
MESSRRATLPLVLLSCQHLPSPFPPSAAWWPCPPPTCKRRAFVTSYKRRSAALLTARVFLFLGPSPRSDLHFLNFKRAPYKPQAVVGIQSSTHAKSKLGRRVGRPLSGALYTP